MKHMLLRMGMCGLLALGLSGCATRYQVRLDALGTGEGTPDAGGGVLTYVLASQTPEVKESDLFFKELARHLEPVLAGQGFQPVPQGGTADLVIEVDAHLSDPMVETYSYSEPVHISYPRPSFYMRVPVVDKRGRVVRFSYSYYGHPYGYGYSGTGWVERNRQVTVFDKILKLSARHLLEDGAVSEELWMIQVSMRDTSTDYRAALPYMLVAAAPYIGRRTAGEQFITVQADDPEVKSYQARLLSGR